MSIPGFTAARSLLTTLHTQPSEPAHPRFLRNGKVIPALSATGDWEDCAAGCGVDPICLGMCGIYAGWPSFPGSGGNGGGPPLCQPGISACHKLNGKWVRTIITRTCSLTVVPC